MVTNSSSVVLTPWLVTTTPAKVLAAMVWVDTDEDSGVRRDGILERHFSRDFWAKIQVFSDSSFCPVFYSHFSFLLNAIHE